MSQPFAGIRVIDFTQVLAGPFATQQLAQQGVNGAQPELIWDADNSWPNKGSTNRQFEHT